MAALKGVSDLANPTTTHRMIAALDIQGLLQRCYTQNIDGLESRLVGCFPPLGGITPGDVEAGEYKCIMLHGSLQFVWCNKCRDVKPWLHEHTMKFKAGNFHPCSCGELFPV